MPLASSEFQYEVQVAFFIYDFLEDVWEGMSGTYLGKRWSNIEYLFKVHEIEDPKTMLLIMKLWESIVVQYRADKAEQKRKAEKKANPGAHGPTGAPMLSLSFSFCVKQCQNMSKW